MTRFGVTKRPSAPKGAGPDAEISRRPLFYRHDAGERSRRLTRVPAAPPTSAPGPARRRRENGAA